MAMRTCFKRVGKTMEYSDSEDECKPNVSADKLQQLDERAALEKWRSCSDGWLIQYWCMTGDTETAKGAV